MSNGFFIKSKKNLEILKEGILKLIAPCNLLGASFVFLTSMNVEESDQMFQVIKIAIYILDFVAIVIATRIIYGLLYDLDIIKGKIHKAKINEEE